MLTGEQVAELVIYLGDRYELMKKNKQTILYPGSPYYETGGMVVIEDIIRELERHGVDVRSIWREHKEG